jgi:hypothetical protein
MKRTVILQFIASSFHYSAGTWRSNSLEKNYLKDMHLYDTKPLKYIKASDELASEKDN